MPNLRPEEGGPVKIGRYTVDELIARGGMAEVFLARAEGPAGFSKQVVIKRILPQFVEEERFVRMFLDEANLAGLLNHPNIAQVFDFGEEQGSYFIAMEYIEGVSLRNVIRHHTTRGLTIDPRMAAYLVSGACEGLHYAHSLCDVHGASYNIVHRDVSPDNVLVSTSGVTKVVDFGIAKAAVNLTRTDAGVIKGKYAYVAPEVIRGEAIDRLVDVYALGITLYELLTGQVPFLADYEVQLLHKILNERPEPAHKLDPKIPRLLSELVAMAMNADREKRFADARAFQAALDNFLALSKPRLTSLEVADLVSKVNAKSERRTVRAPSVVPGPKAVLGSLPPGVGQEEDLSAPTRVPQPEGPSHPAPRTGVAVGNPVRLWIILPAAILVGFALGALTLFVTLRHLPAAGKPLSAPEAVLAPKP